MLAAASLREMRFSAAGAGVVMAGFDLDIALSLRVGCEGLGGEALIRFDVLAEVGHAEAVFIAQHHVGQAPGPDLSLDEFLRALPTLRQGSHGKQARGWKGRGGVSDGFPWASHGVRRRRFQGLLARTR